MMLKSVIAFGVLAAFCAALPAISLEGNLLQSQIDSFKVRDVIDDIEAIIEKGFQRVANAVKFSENAVEVSLIQFIDTIEDEPEAAEKAINDAVSKVEKQIEELGDKLNDCAKEEAAKLGPVAEAGIENIQACFSNSKEAAEELVEDAKKIFHAASDKVEEAAKPFRACGELPPDQQLTCKSNKEPTFGLTTYEIVLNVTRVGLIASGEINGIGAEFQLCVYLENVTAVTAIAKIGDDVAACIAE